MATDDAIELFAHVQGGDYEAVDAVRERADRVEQIEDALIEILRPNAKDLAALTGTGGSRDRIELVVG